MSFNRLPRLLLAPLLLGVLLMAACDGDGDEPEPESTPTVAMDTTATIPTATPEVSEPDGGSVTPTVEVSEPEPGGDCPINQNVCGLAEEIETALANDNYDAIAGLIEPSEFECPEEGQADPVADLCDQAPEGTDTVTGYGLARRYSEGFVTDEAGLTAFLQNFVQSSNAGASDAFGDGAPRLYAVSCAEGSPPDCSRATIIFGAILGPDGQTRREVLVFWLDLPIENTEMPIDSVWDGITLPDEDEIFFEAGGNLFDVGQVYVLN